VTDRELRGCSQSGLVRRRGRLPRASRFVSRPAVHKRLPVSWRAGRGSHGAACEGIRRGAWSRARPRATNAVLVPSARLREVDAVSVQVELEVLHGHGGEGWFGDYARDS
jgi:hypothetical protein